MLVEWPDRAGDRLPAARLTVRLATRPDDPGARDAELVAAGAAWVDRLDALHG